MYNDDNWDIKPNIKKSPPKAIKKTVLPLPNRTPKKTMPPPKSANEGAYSVLPFFKADEEHKYTDLLQKYEEQSVRLEALERQLEDIEIEKIILTEERDKCINHLSMYEQMEKNHM